MAEPLVLFPVSDLVTATSRTLDVGGRTFHTFAIVSNGFSGSLTIQGQYNSEGATWHNVRYWEFDPDTGIVTGPFIAPIVPPATGVRHYYVIDPWRVMRALKTVPHGGTIGVDYFPQPLDAGFLTLSGIGGTGGAGGGGGSTATVVQQDPDQLNSNALVWDSEGPVGPENPLPVEVLQLPDRLPPIGVGENHIGQVGGYGVVRRIAITRPANATPYTANDVIMDRGAGQMVIPNAARVPGGACYLHGISVKGDQAGGGGAETWQPKVFIEQYRRTTPLADNAPLAMTYAVQQQTQFLRAIALPALSANAGATFDESVIENISVLLQAAPGQLDLPIELQTLTAFTPSSGALYEIVFFLTQL